MILSKASETKPANCRLRPLLLVTLGLMLLSTWALADASSQGPRPDWEPGQYWQSATDASGESLEYWVLGVRDIRELPHYVLAQRNRDAEAVSVALAFAPIRAPFPRSTNTPDSQTYLDFPLQVGNAWTVRQAASAGILSAAGIEAQLPALEKVETGFGTFDAFRIEYARGEDVWTLWYAPHAQSWIKQTNPADGSAFVLRQTWRFSQGNALNSLYGTIEALLTVDPRGMRRLLNDLIRFQFAPDRADALKAFLVTPAS